MFPILKSYLAINMVFVKFLYSCFVYPIYAFKREGVVFLMRDREFRVFSIFDADPQSGNSGSEGSGGSGLGSGSSSKKTNSQSSLSSSTSGLSAAFLSGLAGGTREVSCTHVLVIPTSANTQVRYLVLFLNNCSMNKINIII